MIIIELISPFIKLNIFKNIMQKLSPFHLKLNVQTLDKQLKHVPSNISKTMIYSANYKLSLYSKVSLLRPLDVKMLMVILLDGDITCRTSLFIFIYSQL